MSQNPKERITQIAAELGLSADTMELVRVLPLVYVAWSDGEIQDEERTIVKAQAASLGFKSVESQDALAAWLESRPDARFFERGLKLLSYLLATLPYDDAKEASGDIEQLCLAVAEAAGTLTEGATYEPSERLAIKKVVARLNLGSRVATRKLLRDVMELREKG